MITTIPLRPDHNYHYRTQFALGISCYVRAARHRYYDTLELPEAAGRLMHDRLATDWVGNIASVAAPLEPSFKDFVFTRAAAGDCANPAFCQHGTRTFSRGGTIVVVAQDMQCWWRGEHRVRRLAEARMSGTGTPRVNRAEK